VPYVTRQYCAFVLAGDISARQHCAPTTMLAGDSYMCQQSIFFHVSAQIVFGLVHAVINDSLGLRNFLSPPPILGRRE
jgi:hypothetical protein